jgi:hypothetical protein
MTFDEFFQHVHQALHPCCDFHCGKSCCNSLQRRQVSSTLRRRILKLILHYLVATELSSHVQHQLQSPKLLPSAQQSPAEAVQLQTFPPAQQQLVALPQTVTFQHVTAVLLVHLQRHQPPLHAQLPQPLSFTETSNVDFHPGPHRSQILLLLSKFPLLALRVKKQ